GRPVHDGRRGPGPRRHRVLRRGTRHGRPRHLRLRADHDVVADEPGRGSAGTLRQPALTGRAGTDASAPAEASVPHDGVMNDRVDDERGATLASMASVLADATRATFLVALLDGRAWTATELARHAGVAPSTATAHLHRLRNSGLITEVRQGRHRYVRLADPATADLVESLVSAAPDVAEPVRSLSASTRRRALAFARTCYDHLAGTLGVAVTDAMTARGFLTWETGLAVTDDGAHWLTTLDPQGWPPGRGRAPVRPCLDWT